MVGSSIRRGRIVSAIIAALALVVAPIAVGTASASTDGTGVVINEVYLSGGSTGAAYANKFVELYNPGPTAVSIAGWSLQYRPATGAGAATGVVALTGSIASKGYFLVQGASNGTSGAALPTPDVFSTLNPSGSSGTLILAKTATALTLPTGSVTANPSVADLLGYGTSNTFETADAAAPAGNTDVKSLVRTGFVDTDSDLADFSLTATITPQAAGSGPVTPPAPPVALSIAQIQGTTDVSPQVGKAVTTTGIVTAAYPTGGFNGYFIQTPGTGGAVDLATHPASDGLFVYSASTAASVSLGEYVSVTGTVSEFANLTELTVANTSDLTELDASAVAAPKPATVEFPATDAQRESLEGMLIAPQGPYTVTDNYSTNQYGEIGLAHDTMPLITPTAVAPVGSAGYAAVIAKNAALKVTLDDGASTNYLSTANQSKPLPWLTKAAPVRVGAPVTFTRPVILDYRNGAWKLQPTSALTPDDAATVQPATLGNTRTSAPNRVGGTITIGTFNVLNYFPTTGDSRVGCTYYNDRDGTPITVANSDAAGCGVRGAATEASFLRQQAKIVSAITALGADVVSLEEIENSAKVGQDRDAAVATLVAALNAAHPGTWSYVPSPKAVPAIADTDVIRTAFIYKKRAVVPVGESHILIGSPAFADAREPLAQAFRARGWAALDPFLIIANHFKSKGGSGATGDNADTGQGSFTGDRVRQAQALLTFADQQKRLAHTEKVFLVGDFNAYEFEDPITTITAAGYVDQDPKTGKQTYAFGGMVGSLDHVFASPAANRAVTGVDVWNINSVESVALEYSRFNSNALNLYDDSPYRSSDHDPVVLGLSLGWPFGGWFGHSER
ncbi:ExeM/NucH family extracellular endonuclease [Lacisediminihabitans sp.]|uniref:ExeM/NucH family extracellular endonuclease n=1 Tax=Lacisediminihabitans sp. TaxID=2787631 RepID=UPI00374D0CCD